MSELGRDKATGQYVEVNNWDRLCRCGHTLGRHAAACVGGQRPCFESDFDPKVVCDCERFRAAKEKRP